MKEFLTKEQTERMIEFGCKTEYSTFSLSEMLELLPTGVSQGFFIICRTGINWGVSYNHELISANVELIDALFNMYVKLKERDLI